MLKNLIASGAEGELIQTNAIVHGCNVVQVRLELFLGLRERHVRLVSITVEDGVKGLNPRGSM